MPVGSLIGLFVFILQELGALLGFGAQTVLGVAAAAEEDDVKVLHRARLVVHTGLWFVISAQALVTAAYALIGQGDTLYEPVRLFGWLLIAAALLLSVGERTGVLTKQAGGALGAGTWFAIVLYYSLPLGYPAWTKLAGGYIACLALALLLFATISMSRKKPHTARAIIPAAQPLAKPAALPAMPIRIPLIQPAPASKAPASVSMSAENPLPSVPIPAPSIPTKSVPLSANLEPKPAVQTARELAPGIRISQAISEVKPISFVPPEAHVPPPPISVSAPKPAAPAPKSAPIPPPVSSFVESTGSDLPVPVPAHFLPKSAGESVQTGFPSSSMAPNTSHALTTLSHVSVMPKMPVKT